MPALFHLGTGEPRYLQASRNAWRWFDQQHMLPYGVASGEEYLSGVGAFRLTETCNVVAGIWSMTWLYRIEGHGNWGDRIESAMFNAGPAPIARDFQSMCYYQSPNRIEADRLPSEALESSGPGCLKFSRFGHPRIMCCAGNVNRLIPLYLQHLWMATADGGLAATLYGPCTVTALAGERVPVKLICETGYPFDEAILVRVEPERVASFPLYFRVPGWCPGMRVLVNGRPARAQPDGKGFVRLARTWEKGDRVLLLLPMVGDGSSAAAKPSTLSASAPRSRCGTTPPTSRGGCPTPAFTAGRCCLPCRSPTGRPTSRTRTRGGDTPWMPHRRGGPPM